MSLPSPARALFGRHEAILVALLAAVFAVASWMEPSFVRAESQLEIAPHAFELALLSLPMTFIIIAGGIDLSVGSIMALSSVALGLGFQHGYAMWKAGTAALAIGALAGALNGFFVAFLRVHPLLVTLATLAAYRGLAEGISLGKPISGFPESFQHLGFGTLVGLPIPLLILALVALLAVIMAAKSKRGAHIYAIGDNEPAAQYCGIEVARTKFLLFTLSGLAAALCGIIFAARRNTAKADIGTGIELEVITAVVLGGTSIFGGRGTMIGTLLGVILIHEVREFVSWHWRHDELIMIVIGAILIGSVLANNLASRRRV